ncbi:MAG TPA: hypothetical protein VGS60_17445 [Actinomycetes bacterium]|nr:hypothetical protein [Actinomycetes bacterium]
MASVEDNATRLNLLVRTADGTTPAVTVVVADLSMPPLGVDDDVEVVIEGDRCPRP